MFIAYTPIEQKKIKAASMSFRENPNFDTEKVIQELETGEAVVSFLNEYGQPDIAERAYILPPQSMLGTADISIIKNIINNSDLKDVYNEIIDQESAYEIIEKKNIEKEKQLEQDAKNKEIEKYNKKKVSSKRSNKIVDRTINSAASTIGRKIGNSIFKGLFK